MNTTQNEIKSLYKSFFKKLSIDNQNGELIINKHYYKFATYPFIGSKYGSAHTKILFVGMDIGADETPGYIQSFEERSNIETHPIEKKNPHIAGTYISALHFLKDEFGWEKEWNITSKYPTCQQALKSLKMELSEISPLSFVALTNYFKFVDKGRENRSGSANRKYINEFEENTLLINEINILQPNLIIFQSASFFNYPRFLESLKKLQINIKIAPHPANRDKNGRQPVNYINRTIPAFP